MAVSLPGSLSWRTHVVTLRTLTLLSSLFSAPLSMDGMAAHPHCNDLHWDLVELFVNSQLFVELLPY